MRQFGKILVVALLLTAVWTPAAQAVPAWYHCVVELTGTGDHEIVFFRLSDTNPSPAFTGKWFKAPENLKKKYMAIGLTAMSLDKTLLVKTDLLDGGIPTLVSMYLEQ